MLLLGQTGQERFLGQQFQQPFAQPGAFGGQHELFGTAVGGVGTPLDQPLAFELVDHDGGATLTYVPDGQATLNAAPCANRPSPAR